MFVLVLADLEQANVILDFQYEWGGGGGRGGWGGVPVLEPYLQRVDSQSIQELKCIKLLTYLPISHTICALS